MRTLKIVERFGVAFLCLCVTMTGSASRKEQLERAAELAVERLAEKVAERTVEKSFESGKPTTETEKIRLSHSSVKNYDGTPKFPGFFSTPYQRKEYERIAREREVAELAAKQTTYSRLFKRRAQAAGSSPNYHQNHQDSERNGKNSQLYRHQKPIHYPFLQNDHQNSLRANLYNNHQVSESNYLPAQFNTHVDDSRKFVQDESTSAEKDFYPKQTYPIVYYFLPAHAVAHPDSVQYFLPQSEHQSKS